jgi:predicted ABC-type transport system involved in lysophospholipase L1 biosynthesis ATPase subunit
MAFTNELALRCNGLHRYLGQGDARVHVLKGVSFEARRGEVYAIVGPSGCGKSTLLYLLGLLDRPDGGEIEINGQLMSTSDDVARTAARCEHIGFVFQFHFLMLDWARKPIDWARSYRVVNNSVLLSLGLSLISRQLFWQMNRREILM